MMAEPARVGKSWNMESAARRTLDRSEASSVRGPGLVQVVCSSHGQMIVARMAHLV